MRPCGYCSRLVKSDLTSHKLGSTNVECPQSWRPWERLDPKAIRRGEWFIRFYKHPLFYSYVVKRANGDYRVIPPISPYVTAPMDPRAYDLVVAQIPQGF